MIEMANGHISLAYDGSLNSAVSSYLVQNLNTGAYYAFYLTAVNFNGESLSSSEMTAVVCLAPLQLEQPVYVSSTQTSITLAWNPPTSTGGCPILSYALFSDFGVSGATYTEVDANQIENKPYLNSHTVQGLLHTGAQYNFYLKVFNEVGDATSIVTNTTLAAVPN
jgi:hypothetical protein